MSRGRYIVIEGPEGVGKTTQLHELARRLQAAGLPVRTLREPDSQSDLTARAIRQLTQDPRYPMNTRTEVLLYNAARSQSLQIIQQSVEHGVICLVDRNYLTTLAIQYYGRGDVPDYQTINGIINFAVGGIEPDLCIVMDAPVATLKDRVKDRYNGERFDNLDDAFLERVRAGYLWEANQRQLPVVFATEDKDTIANEIWAHVSKELAIRKNDKPALTSPIPSVKEIIEQKTELPVKVEATTDYFVPQNLNSKVKEQYVTAMDTLLKLHASLETNLTEHCKDANLAKTILRAVLPVATRGELISERPTVVAKLAKEVLADTHASGDSRAVSLIDYWPKNELLLVADMLYPHSSLPLDQLQAVVSSLSYSKKADVFSAYVDTTKSSETPVLEKAYYSWDLFSSYVEHRRILEVCTSEAVQYQSLTPRYGYDVPELIEQANLVDQYESCFELSLKLYSLLQKHDYTHEAQYATLLGHKLRWTMTLNAAELLALSKHRGALVNEMRERLAEVHPTIAGSSSNS